MATFHLILFPELFFFCLSVSLSLSQVPPLNIGIFEDYVFSF